MKLFRRKLSVVFVATFLGAGPRVYAALAPEERAIADWLAKKQDEMVALLEKAVKIDSPSRRIASR